MGWDGKGLRENFNPAGGEIVAGGDDLHVAGLHGLADDGFDPVENAGDAAGVSADGVVDFVAGLLLDGGESGFDGFDETVDVARSVAAADGGAHCAALGVADDDDEGGVEVLDGVFDAADGVVIEDVAGIAGTKRSPRPWSK